ncbi:MAG: protein jag [Gottschalkiaceae bacterium]|jgi:spoIIIJ-associated protein|nr:MAG: protein jag [Gottschalkiaceae bacterium]
MIEVEKSAKTVDEAVKLALEELKAEKEQVEVEVLEYPSRGILGIIGTKLARVKVVKKEKDPLEIKEKIFEKKDIRIVEYTFEKETAKKFLREVLTAMDIKAEIRLRDTKDGLYISLSGPRMGTIIGRRGQTLDSLQYLTSLVVNKDKDRENYVKVILDTEDYRRKREETLNRLARRLGDKVSRSGKKVELEPMNPYERRIIHSALQNYEDIITYSEGEEPFRKVIISHK